jgi:hypothetical protein
MQITTDELEALTGLPRPRIESFLGAFSTEFGQPEASPSFTGHHMLRTLPIIHDGSGHYLCSYVGNLLLALRPRCEEALKPADEVPTAAARWERYNRHRTLYVESRAAELLTSALRPESAWANVVYDLGEADVFELDGLLVLDSVALVIEAKAAALSAPARRGAPDRLRRDVERVLQEASDQLRRFHMAVQKLSPLSLRSADGTSMDFKAEDVTEAFSVVVTLDDFSGVGPTVWELAAAGLLDVPDPLPWIVSLHELEIICDLVEYAAMLPHYLLRRRRLNELKLLHAADELDLFIFYLEHGLYFDEMAATERPDAIRIQSMTDDLDAYYMWKRGHRRAKAEKPHQRMHPRFREIIRALDDQRLSGFVDVSGALLSMPDKDRQSFAQRYAEMRRRSGRDMKLHDASMAYTPDEARGLTAMTAPHRDRLQLEAKLPSYCLMKKHQVGADQWVGIAGTDREIVWNTVVHREAWKPDARLEAAIETLVPMPKEGMSERRRAWLAEARPSESRGA